MSCHALSWPKLSRAARKLKAGTGSFQAGTGGMFRAAGTGSMFQAGTAGISFVTRREAAAYQGSCCGACSFDERMRRQLELHALYEEAPSNARVLVVRRDGAMTIGMGNRMSNDARALLIAMHLDRALLFAECAYDGVA